MNALDEFDNDIDLNYEYEVPQEHFFQFTQPTDITFSYENETKLTIHTENMSYTLGDGVAVDEATELFWTLIAGDSPNALHAQLEEAQKEIASLMVYKTLWEQNLEAKEKMATIEGGTDYERAMKVIS